MSHSAPYPCRDWSFELRTGGVESTGTDHKAREEVQCGFRQNISSYLARDEWNLQQVCGQGCTKAWSCFLRVSKEPFAVSLSRDVRGLSGQVRVSTDEGHEGSP